MSFTAKEKQKWLEEKRQREPNKVLEASSAGPLYTCLHCNNKFSISNGTVTEDAAICDVCNY